MNDPFDSFIQQKIGVLRIHTPVYGKTYVFITDCYFGASVCIKYTKLM